MIMIEEKGCILKKFCPSATLSTMKPTCIQLPWDRTQASTVWPVGICLRYGTARYNIPTYNRITSHNCPNHRTVTSKVVLENLEEIYLPGLFGVKRIVYMGSLG
jgi:hypothetical protein